MKKTTTTSTRTRTRATASRMASPKPPRRTRAAKAVPEAIEAAVALPEAPPSAVEPAEAAVAAPAPERVRKPAPPRRVRQACRLSEDEYARLGGLKKRAASLARPTKRGDLLRAGLHVLLRMPDDELFRALDTLPAPPAG